MRPLLLLLAAFAALDAQPLRVLTFNVRYPSKDDGPNLWDKRRDLLVNTIRDLAPDVMGTQELFYSQGEYIAGKLPEYAWFGRSRRGDRTDEHMGVFYRRDRLKLIDSGDFWLSETPEAPGSMSWGVSLPRMVTWAVFDSAQFGRLHYFNTHYPHRREDAEARGKCSAVLAARIRKLPAKATVILTGDFNTGAGTPPYATLTALLKDSWVETAAKAGPEGTFHGFRGKPGTARIDWVLYRGALKPVKVEAVTRNEDGRYPSDHFPVLAVFEQP